MKLGQTNKFQQGKQKERYKGIQEVIVIRSRVFIPISCTEIYKKN